MTPWKFVLLNSEHRGSELTLSLEQSIGSDEQLVDLVINMPQCPAKLCVLTVLDDGVHVLLEDSRLDIEVDGQSFAAQTPLPALVPIKVGPLAFMIAMQETAWPEPLPLHQTATEPNKVANHAKAKTSHTYQRLSKLLSLASVMAIGMAVFLYFEISAAPTVTEQHPLDLSRAKTQLASAARPHLLIDWDESKQKINLSGYVESKRDRKLLIEQAEALNIGFSSDIRTMEEIKFAAHFILQNLQIDGIDIRSADTAGELEFIVDSANLGAWSRAEPILQRDIPGLAGWQLSILEQQPALEYLNELLADTSFVQKVYLEDKGDRIAVIGQLSGSQIREFEQLKRQFTETFGSHPRLLLTAPTVKATTQLDLNLKFRTVSLGQYPYIVLANGERYFEGARLPNGAWLKSINRDGVYLETAKKNYMINFKQNL